MAAETRTGHFDTALIGSGIGARSRQNSRIGQMNGDSNRDQQSAGGLLSTTASGAAHEIAVALLTGGGDRPYAFGLATELIARGVSLDVVGSDDLDCSEFHKPGVNFLNLRGDQNPEVNFFKKMFRVLAYYSRLIRYSATAKPRIFHILWNNKLELFDRTLLVLYYKALGKKIVLTLHNVNKGKRDSKDSFLNRLTLKMQYRLADHIFVHTEQMKSDVIGEFNVLPDRIGVIPFGINNAVPNTSLSAAEARRHLGIRDGEKTILFFGNIAPYKGLEFLTAAFHRFLSDRRELRLIIAGWPKNCENYWRPIREAIQQYAQEGRIILKAEYIPDEETEVYFKAADVLVLPYRYIYQSGVLFLGYSFGLPVLAADVGTLKEEIMEGKTGFVFRPEDPVDLARAIERYFASDLFADLNGRRQEIRDYATKRHSWDVVGHVTMSIYAGLLRKPYPGKLSNRDASRASVEMNDPS
jgi:D-inositol-3-phosphate glycosyltransferase